MSNIEKRKMLVMEIDGKKVGIPLMCVESNNSDVDFYALIESHDGNSDAHAGLFDTKADTDMVYSKTEADSRYATLAQGLLAESALQEETDPTVPPWAKAAQKPLYTASEVGAAAANHTHPGYAGSSHSHVIGDLPSVVQYVSQTLTSAQQEQARENIGAGTSSLVIGTGSTNAAAGISHAGTQSYNYMGGIKVPDGRIVLAAHEADYTRVVTANCTSYTQINKGASNSNTYGGGCYVSSTNRVVFTPHGAARAWSYNVANNTMVDSGIAHNQGSRAFTGHGILLNDGRILFVPFDAATVGLYTPSTNTYTNGAAVTAGDSKYRGGVKLPDGRVLLVPFNAFYIGLYNPSNNTVTNVAAHGRGSYAFSGGVLLPEEGKVVLIPYRSAYVGIYDIATQTYSNGPAHNAAYRGSGEYAGFWHGGVYLPEKKTIVMIPRGCNYIGLLKIL